MKNLISVCQQTNERHSDWRWTSNHTCRVQEVCLGRVKSFMWDVVCAEGILNKIWTRRSGKRASSQTKAKTKAEEKHIKIRPFIRPHTSPPLWSTHILFRFAPRAEFWETFGWGSSKLNSSCFKVFKTQIYSVCNANRFVYLWWCECCTKHSSST